VIRFSCPHCDRAYLLADALAHLPLLCKGCGQRLTVPAPQPEPPAKTSGGLTSPGSPGKTSGGLTPAGTPAPAPKQGAEVPGSSVPNNGPGHPLAHPVGSPTANPAASAPHPPAPTPPSLLDDEAILAAKFQPIPGPSAPAAAPTRPVPRQPAAGWDAPESVPFGRRVLAGLLDMIVILILLVLGATASELVLGKSSREVLVAASSAPKFPPVDLIVWLGGPLLAGLVYAWLGTRGWTVGAWLKRRPGG
jgi:hypothetical protein